MLAPVPGLSHIKLWCPPPRPPEKDPASIPPTVPVEDGSDFVPVLLLALQAAFGMREVAALPATKFSPLVRSQITARLRSSPARGPVRLIRVHVRERGELFGTAVGARRLVAFTAVTDGRRITSFRVL